LIQNEAMMLQKIDCIYNNPVKRGYLDQAVHWRYSSACNYDGEVIEVDKCRQLDPLPAQSVGRRSFSIDSAKKGCTDLFLKSVSK